MAGWLQKIIEEQSNSGLSMAQANELMQEIDREHMDAGVYIPQRNAKQIDKPAIKFVGEKYEVALYGATMEENHGTLITYYALYKAVEKLGYSIGLIPPPLSENEEENRSDAIRFCEEYMSTCKQYAKSEMKNLYDVADIFLLGSDQIWNYTRYPEQKETLYLDFIKNKKKKIVYGASFGSDIPTIFPDYPERYPKIMTAIQRFDAIAVSEESGVDICNTYYSTEAVQVMDPVFLLTRKDYLELAQNAKNKPAEKYICTYTMSSAEEFQIVTSTMSEKLELPCVSMTVDDFQAYNMEEWLYNILNSEFVLTDSYYAVCLAIIFKKNFIYIQNTLEVTRIESLLRKLDLMNRCFRSCADFMEHKEFMEQDIDYDVVFKRLDREIFLSQNWLRTALSAKKKVQCRDKMPGKKVSDSLYESMYSTDDASEYYGTLDSLKEDLIIMITKKGKKDGYITKIKFFADAEIDPETKAKSKENGFSYIDDFGNKTILKEIQEFSYLTYYFNDTKLTCYSEGKSYDENKRKTAEFVVEQRDRKDIYRTKEDGLYTLVYSKKEQRVIDYIYLNISKGSELQVKHLLD